MVKIGDKAYFSHEHLFQTVTFSAKVVKIDGENAWVEIPRRIRDLPVPPLGGKQYGLYPIKSLQFAR